MARCTATNRAGSRCGNDAIPGGSICRLHGGAAPAVRAAAQRRLDKEDARAECARLGIPVDQLDPGEALLSELRETAGNVAFYRELLQQLPVHPEPDGASGVYTYTYHPSGLPTGEGKPHVLVELYNEERRHLVAVAVACHRAGVEERQIRLVEHQAELIAQFARTLLADLQIDPQSERARAALRRGLMLIAGGSDDAA